VVHRGLIFEVLMPNGIMEFTEFSTAQVEKSAETVRMWVTSVTPLTPGT